jgi:hypothetical protein
MRVLLDTNVLVSALITSNTPPDLIYRAWRKQAFDLIFCDEQLIEIERVLAYPKLQRYVRESEAALLLSGLRQLAIIIRVRDVEDYTADPADNILIAAALAGDCDYLVSGDKQHMQGFETGHSLSVLSPAEFLERLAS